MLTEVALTHPCNTTIHLLGGAWTTPRGRPTTHCPGCGEWLGSPFVSVELVLRRTRPDARPGPIPGSQGPAVSVP